MPAEGHRGRCTLSEDLCSYHIGHMRRQGLYILRGSHMGLQLVHPLQCLELVALLHPQEVQALLQQHQPPVLGLHTVEGSEGGGRGEGRAEGRGQLKMLGRLQQQLQEQTQEGRRGVQWLGGGDLQVALAVEVLTEAESQLVLPNRLQSLR